MVGKQFQAKDLFRAIEIVIQEYIIGVRILGKEFFLYPENYSRGVHNVETQCNSLNVLQSVLVLGEMQNKNIQDEQG